MVRNPPQRCRAIVEGAGKPCFRRASIVDGNDRAPAAVRKPVADRVVRVEIAEHEAATVTEDDGRQASLARGPVDTHVQRTRRTRYHPVVDRMDRGFRRRDQVRLVAGPHVVDRNVRGWRTQFAALVCQQLGEDGIDWHAGGAALFSAPRRPRSRPARPAAAAPRPAPWSAPAGCPGWPRRSGGSRPSSSHRSPCRRPSPGRPP